MHQNDPYMSADTLANFMWSTAWSTVLRPGEKHPVPQLRDVLRLTTPWGVVTVTPFLCGQGLDPMQFHSKKIARALTHATSGHGVIGVVGLTAPLASSLEPGVRHAQGFAVVEYPRDLPRNPATVHTGPSTAQAMRWVFGALLGEAFADARLARPEVISADALSNFQSKHHQWRINVRLYSGNTPRMVEGAAERIQMALGSPYLRVVPTDNGCELIVGAMPENVEYASAAAEEWASGWDKRVKRPAATAGELDLVAAVARINELGFEVTLRPLGSAS